MGDWQEITETEANELNDLYDEVIRLQERVRALERVQEKPNQAFNAQLIFDVLVYLGFLWLVVKVMGG